MARGRLQLLRLVVRKQLCHSEIEQLDLAVVGDHDVGRLEVAVHDEVPMGMMHGPADFDEPLEPLFHAELVRRAVRSNGGALDVFHHEIGPAVR
jgi:hypothetical protein